VIPNWRLGSTLEQPLSDDGGPSAPSTKDDGRRRRTNMANSSRNGRIISVEHVIAMKSVAAL